MHSSNRCIALKVAWSFLGKPYIWGGDDPMRGFDCSGFVIEVLKSVGVLPRKGDWTAHDLWMKFGNGKLQRAIPGDLVFWQNRLGHVIHVELCVSDGLSIGAAGGGSAILTIRDAIEKNAFIKVRPYNSRPNIKGFGDPCYDCKS